MSRKSSIAALDVVVNSLVIEEIMVEQGPWVNIDSPVLLIGGAPSHSTGPSASGMVSTLPPTFRCYVVILNLFWILDIRIL